LTALLGLGSVLGISKNETSGVKMNKPLKFKVGDKVEHHRFGPGVVREIYANATAGTDEENEYRVKLRSNRYPVTLGEHGLELR